MVRETRTMAIAGSLILHPARVWFCRIIENQHPAISFAGSGCGEVHLLFVGYLFRSYGFLPLAGVVSDNTIAVNLGPECPSHRA